MQTIAADVTWFVCVSVTTVEYYKIHKRSGHLVCGLGWAQGTHALVGGLDLLGLR